MQPIVERLASMIKKNSWQDTFRLAIQNAQASKVPGIQHIQNLDDLLVYANELVTWTPRVAEDPSHTFETSGPAAESNRIENQ